MHSAHGMHIPSLTYDLWIQLVQRVEHELHEAAHCTRNFSLRELALVFVEEPVAPETLCKSLCVYMYVCVCVCVCIHAHKCVCMYEIRSEMELEGKEHQDTDIERNRMYMEGKIEVPPDPYSYVYHNSAVQMSWVWNSIDVAPMQSRRYPAQDWYAALGLRSSVQTNVSTRRIGL